MAGLGKQMRGNGIAQVQRQEFKKGGKAFPDLNEDGEITRADVLKGRGVPGFKKGGYVDMSEEHEGYKETKSGKMKKADMLTARMSKKKKGKIMKGKR
jgi:hypothetical protein